MADLSVFGLNIYYLLGLLLALGVLGLLGLAVIVGLRAGLFVWIQRRSREKHHRRNRRADGQPYPPAIGGVCDYCGRVQGKIYHPPAGPRLCPDCYEPYWRRQEVSSGKVIRR